MSNLSIKRGEKLSTKAGAGLTAKGREKYNRENNANLKAPAPNPKTAKSQGRKNSFCARMNGVRKRAKNNDRATASMKRWNCPQVT